MSKVNLLVSFIVIIALHYVALTFLYEKRVPVVTKPPYQKVSVQLATLKIPTPTPPKPIEKPIFKEQPITTAKEVFKKPIKKEAKRKIVKKKIKKPVKKKVAKKIVKKVPKKKPIKKIVKKEPIKKPIEKKIIQEPKKIEKLVEKKETKILKPTEDKTKQAAKKAAAQSLEKYKKFKNDYKAQLRAAIDRNKKYPVASKRLEEQGTVTVAFTVLKSGLFKDIKVISSSGKKRLDKAALKALIITKSFRAFPKEINKEFMELDVPIKFQIN